MLQGFTKKTEFEYLIHVIDSSYDIISKPNNFVFVFGNPLPTDLEASFVILLETTHFATIRCMSKRSLIHDFAQIQAPGHED